MIRVVRVVGVIRVIRVVRVRAGEVDRRLHRKRQGAWESLFAPVSPRGFAARTVTICTNTRFHATDLPARSRPHGGAGTRPVRMMRVFSKHEGYSKQ